MNFSQEITNYTAKGREKIHKQIESVSQNDFIVIARARDPNETIEFNDNKFHIYNDEMSYVIEVSKQSDLLNLYYGARIDAFDAVGDKFKVVYYACFVGDMQYRYQTGFFVRFPH